MKKTLFANIFLKNGKAVKSRQDLSLHFEGDAVELAQYFEANGADALLIFDLSSEDHEHERNLGVIREIGRAVNLPMMGAGNMKRVEDVKKILYAGCTSAVLNMSKESNRQMLEEVSKRFGKDKIAVCYKGTAHLEEYLQKIQEYACSILLMGDHLHLYEAVRSISYHVIPILSSMEFDKTLALLREENVVGISGSNVADTALSLYQFRERLIENGISLMGTECSVAWSELKLNSDGLIPVVVQDYKNNEVLMVAYMNEEAFNKTLSSGRMTYWSRSRQEIWIKGETSGHYQTLKRLSIDCDNDTLLAKVIQQGAACHTGNRTCFYRDVMKKDGGVKSATAVFEDVYQIILDRKMHPKEGSYTNYLFDKGIDKILKKLGEEATEIVIAAKNPDPEEIKYEAADFLYHLMVLMAERSVTWEDITEELSKR